MNKFSKNLAAISKLYTPERWHESSFMLMTHKYWAQPYTIQSPGRSGARNLCTPGLAITFVWWRRQTQLCLTEKPSCQEKYVGGWRYGVVIS